VSALAELRKQRLASGQVSKAVFCTVSGNFMTNSDVGMAFRRVKAKAGSAVPQKLRWHDMRHTHASLLLAAGNSIRAVAARLGHSDPALTLRVYSHCMPTDDRQCAAGLERMIG
jgi:integrase